MLLIWRGIDLFVCRSRVLLMNTGAEKHYRTVSVSLRAKYVDVTLALNSTRFLRNETEYVPWEVAVRNLKYFIFMLERTEAYGPMQVLTHSHTNNCAGGEELFNASCFPQKYDMKVYPSRRRTCGNKPRSCTTTSATTLTTLLFH